MQSEEEILFILLTNWKEFCTVHMLLAVNGGNMLGNKRESG